MELAAVSPALTARRHLIACAAHDLRQAAALAAPGHPGSGPMGPIRAEAAARPAFAPVAWQLACLTSLRPDLPAAILSLAAARGFAEGNGFLPGQILDRQA